jgi:hypothetical protein
MTTRLVRSGPTPLPGGVEIHQPNNVNTLLPTPFQFKKHGQCGMEISEMLPHTAAIADDLCFIRSMHTEHNNHLEGLNMLLTCKIFPGRPVMGAWISYALGTENQSLPAYVVLATPPVTPSAASSSGPTAICPRSTRRRVQHEGRAGPPFNPPDSASQRTTLDLLK